MYDPEVVGSSHLISLVHRPKQSCLTFVLVTPMYMSEWTSFLYGIPNSYSQNHQHWNTIVQFLLKQ